ncbi:proline-rich receptor-like protein kinase PERK3 isoform X1 [Amborella trichopoda]|uniref:proline-rich receptor-like protein kinase PERK3 isoform X1 n=1 Tax=Amborella trichopoda TaxID=13333 RepID=UPI0009BE7899|nr:proline-rich receptor-like protein kinase PERK3 isoform X1 [Amborella trichopoda]|eukprot:XP_020522772.1 proline-rich receptor-like protein kinase PERK3 isoform X1 [Amborella trichopoda]
MAQTHLSLSLPLLLISIFFPTSNSQAYNSNVCSLNFTVSTFGNSPNCEGGNWDGFLPNNCCSGPLEDYLFALALKSNQTSGRIFPHPREERACLNLLKDLTGIEAANCGLQRLAWGDDNCSGFTVEDVWKNLGAQLGSLRENCKLTRENKLCPLCLKSWDQIGELVSIDVGLVNSSSHVCKFAVLVSMVSTKIEDSEWISGVFECLSQQSDVRVEVKSKDTKEDKAYKGVLTAMGILIGISVAILFMGYVYLKRKRIQSTHKETEALEELPPKVSTCKKLSVKEVYAATNDLSDLNFIGQGSAVFEMLGKVYKGVLMNGTRVAVKHIFKEGQGETFVREVTSLSHVRNPNLVALLGYCEEEEEFFLVYELCCNGSLSEWLFGKDRVLSWTQRLEIAIDSARGLWFLHTYPEGCIVHRDVKPANILLGDDFEAKVSDFGLSKLIDIGRSHVSSEVRGTLGYVDPEYQRNHQVKASGDVYSFGVMLLQILSGKRAINLKLRRPMPLERMAKELTKGGNISEFADPKMKGNYSAEAFDLTLKIALSCTGYKVQRPSMEEVVVGLEKAWYISTAGTQDPPPHEFSYS